MTRRIIAVSSGTALAEQIAGALSDARVESCTFEALASAEPAPTLWILDLDHARARDLLGQVPGTAPILVVLADARLVDVVDLWQVSERIVGFVGSDAMAIARVAARVTAAEPPTLANVLGPRAAITTRTVADHADKVRDLADVRQFAERMPARLHDAIEQCVDELLMNALYAAPVDADGKPVFAGVPVKRRIAMQTGEQVTLQYGADDERFAVTVRDAFGSLDRSTVLRVLHKGLHAEDKVDRKAGGAGLGLYLIASSASAMTFDVVPGIACEVTCVFDRAKQGPPELVFVRRDAAGQPRTAPARAVRSAAARRGLVRAALGIAVAITLIAGLVAASMGPAYASLTIAGPAGAVIEIDGRAAGTIDRSGALIVRDLPAGPHLVIARLADHAAARAVVGATGVVSLSLQPVARVELESEPSGALVDIDGAVVGSTPLRLTGLVPGSKQSIGLAIPGYLRTTAVLDVPAAGKSARIVHSLVRSPELARVRLISDPPGAEIIREGQSSNIDRTYTPAGVFVKVGERHRFTLVMRKHAPLTVEVGGAEGETVTGTLVPTE